MAKVLSRDLVKNKRNYLWNGSANCFDPTFYHCLFQLLLLLLFFFIVALKSHHKHQERLEKIKQGFNPDV